jgi:lysophospholipase L1-like esterase
LPARGAPHTILAAMASPRLPWRKRALRALVALLLAGTAAEAALRLAGRLYLRRVYTSAYRDLDPRPGDVNVLCLGESSTAGMGVAPEESYPKQLENLLRDFHDNPRIRTIVPPHVGQNTSQMANRIAGYLELYRPRLVVVMAGYNNEWSLAESSVVRFLDAGADGALQVRALAALDRLRLFKLSRYAWLRFVAREHSSYMRENERYAWGHPELVRYPPAPWVYAFAQRQRDAFVRAWRADVELLLESARRAGAHPLLMTYHIQPSYLPPSELVSLSERLGLPLVRNDAAFDVLRAQGRLARHLLEDGWHPAASGYALIARNAFQSIWRNGLAAEAAAWTGTKLAFGTPDPEPFLGPGWSDSEVGPVSRYRWTDGARAELRVDLGGPERRILRMRLDPFLDPVALPRQRLHLLVNGRPSASLWLGETATRVHSVVIPEPECRGPATLTLLLPDARAPARIGLGDTRRLGVAVEWMSLEDFPDGARAARIDLGGAPAERFLGAGWSAPEDGARWMQPPRAELLFGWEPNRPATLRMKVRALRPRELAGPLMTVDLNGQRLEPFRVRPTDALPAAYELALPAASLEPRNVLAFEWPAALIDFQQPPGLLVESLELAR